ncbi:MAG: InlB B-repeat-containing protein [Lachnospiraceae bacterium]|nr:InlB B-repeat-containing protein [Lachnospiraceae bacterium]
MKSIIKRIAILEIIALFAANLPAVSVFASPDEFDISNRSITITATSEGCTVEKEGVQYTVNNPSVPVISGNSAGGTLTISAEGNNEAHVILKDLTIDASQTDRPAITANCKAFIEIQGTNTLKGGLYKAGLEHQDCGEDKVLKIDGTGTLNVQGGAGLYRDSWGPAGIGGSLGRNGSYIEINGGIITSTGAGGGAGIGGGGSGGRSGSHITINGGQVTATGGTGASGIGGGEGAMGSDITISGGTVTAQGGYKGAGIGGGFNINGKGTRIRITGGTVKATGGIYGAGIGGGIYADGSSITIAGGTVTAAGGSGAAGIGGGSGGDDTSNSYGTGSDITISGSGTVKASGGGKYEEFTNVISESGAAIGNGGCSAKDGEEVLPNITGLQEGGSITYYPRGNGISAMESGSVTPLGRPYTVTFNANSGSDSVTVSPASKIVFSGESDESVYGDLPSPTRQGYKFVGWYTAITDGTRVTKETSVSLNNDQILYARWARYEEYTITYKNDDGTVRRTQKYPTTNPGNDKLDISPGYREGYNFGGWKVTVASGSWVNDNVYESGMSLDGMYGDITVSGQWDPVRYTVIFHENGGSGSMDNQNREYGDGRQLSENLFTYNGHRFMGWSNLNNDSIILYPASATVYSDKTTNNVYSGSLTDLYALWEYTVVFDTGGGTNIEDQKYYILSDNTLPSAEKNRSVFRGWKAGDVNGNWVDERIYDAGTPLKGKYGDVRLTAVWETVPGSEPQPEPEQPAVYEENPGYQAPVNPDAIVGGFHMSGRGTGNVKIGKQKQGPLGRLAFFNARSSGMLEAFSFNITVDDKADYSIKNGELKMDIPAQYQKPGRTFMILALLKGGKVVTYDDSDNDPETITVNLNNVNGYAFDLNYKD